MRSIIAAILFVATATVSVAPALAYSSCTTSCYGNTCYTNCY